MREIFKLCMVLTVIAAVSAGVLAFVSQKTAEPIRNALREEKMSAVRSVLPAFDNEPDKDMTRIPAGEDTIEFYRGRLNGTFVGAAFPVIAPEGYSGEIEIMVGVDTVGVVHGIAILQHRETPGLGAKIETEDFRNMFKNKSLSDPEVWEVAKDGGTFRQITGATISSRAVTRAVAHGLEFFKENKAAIFINKQAASLAPPAHEVKPAEMRDAAGADSTEAGDAER